jgi:hypothetical protein
MIKSHKTLFTVLGIGTLALIIVLGVAAFGVYRYVSAAVQPTPGPGNSATPALMDQYWGLFLKTFAANLGVDQAKLDKAFVDAVNATADQAVKDGKITQAQADSIKSRYSQGLSAQKGMPFMFGFGPGMLGGGFDMRGSLTTADIASALGMKEQDLITALQSGKSIADVAKAQNKDLATVKQALLDSAKAKLDKEVADKTLTQAQADQIYQNLTNSIDNTLNNTHSFQVPGGNGGFGRRKPGTKTPTAPGT